MDLRNDTPFPALDFDSVDQRGQTFHVVVARATFEILEDGALRPVAEQKPLVMADELYGAIGASSIKEESDLAPYKPKCDVVVLGNAVAPGGRMSRRFESGVTIRRNGTTLLDKRLAVTGPRNWKRRLYPFGFWKLTEPEPIRSLPLRYEYAYGGECRIHHNDPCAKRVPKKRRFEPEQRAAHPDGIEKAPVAHTCCDDNIVGRGFAEKWYVSAKRLRRVPAPQIESIKDPIKKLRKSYMPQGFGVLAKASACRRAFVGTIDKAFIQSGRALPEDFDFAFWNGAPPDMQIPWLEGNEEVTLTNIDSNPRLVLPEHKLCAEITYQDSQMAAMDFNIDTLIINAEQKTVSLVYRLKLPMEPEIQSLSVQQLSGEEREILMEHVQSVNHQALQYKELSNE